ncbi:MAG: DUF4142 domain-containing protein [Chitinophagales bacterium]
MKKFIIMLAGSALLFSCKQDTKTYEDQKELADKVNDEKFGKRVEKDADFLVDAIDISMLEVSVSEMALSRSENKEVKDIANMLIFDHQQSIKEMNTLAGKKGVLVPNQLSDEAMKKRSKLRDAKPEDFDKEYIELLDKEHKDAIDRFEKEMRETQDPEYSAWASASLITLRSHHDSIEKCLDKLREMQKN